MVSAEVRISDESECMMYDGGTVITVLPLDVTTIVSIDWCCGGDCGDGGGGGNGNAVTLLCWKRCNDDRRYASFEKTDKGGGVATIILFGVGGGADIDGGSDDDFLFKLFRAFSSSMSARESGALHRNKWLNARRNVRFFHAYMMGFIPELAMANENAAL